MKIAIVSDIHDHVWNLAAALPDIAQADAVLCCGDLCSPFVLAQLAGGISAPLHLVFGNNDGDTFRLTQVAADHSHVHLHGEFFHGDVGGIRIAMTHYPAVARGLDPGGLDLIAYGHDHTYAVGIREGAWVVNPGTLMGYAPGEGRDVTPTFLVYDSASNEMHRGEVHGNGASFAS